MNIRRLLLDVDKALARPSLLEIASAISRCRGVEAAILALSEVDVETMGLEITIEGNGLDYDEIAGAIADSGAVVHGIEQIAVGDRIIERTEIAR
jgi:uncharacterized protein